MDEIYLQCAEPEPADRSIAADVLLREEPDEEDEAASDLGSMKVIPETQRISDATGSSTPGYKLSQLVQAIHLQLA
jgi:hypothetical protein